MAAFMGCKMFTVSTLFYCPMCFFFLSFCTPNMLRIYFVDIWYVSVWKSVCAQPPKWNAAAERDWNQYFLLCHLSHLYKAETIWTPVYSTLASFIKLPHLAKTHTHPRTRTHTHTVLPCIEKAAPANIQYLGNHLNTTPKVFSTFSSTCK